MTFYMVHEKKKFTNYNVYIIYIQHSVLLKIKWPPTCDNTILGVTKVIILRRCVLKYLEVMQPNV